MMNGGMGLGMGVWMLLLLVGFIALVVWLVRVMFPQGSSHREHEKPLEIAQRRYAEGEITREEFESLKQDLT